MRHHALQAPEKTKRAFDAVRSQVSDKDGQVIVQKYLDFVIYFLSIQSLAYFSDSYCPHVSGCTFGHSISNHTGHLYNQ